jgi:flagella basal body P-ring formation protein FlgA
VINLQTKIVLVMTFTSLAARAGYFLFFCLVFPISGHPSELMTGSDINDQINQFLERENIKGKPVIKMEQKFLACGEDLDVEPLFSNWKTLKLTCPGNDQWRLMVRMTLEEDHIHSPAPPAMTSTSVAATTPAVSAPSSGKAVPLPPQGGGLRAVALRRSMTKGEIITRGDLMMIPISAQQNYGLFINPEDLIGRRIRTPVNATDPVRARQLEPRYLVEKNKLVTIAVSVNGLYVEMTGKALQDGQIGEVVKAENLSSGKTITGKVTGQRKISPLH